MGKFDGILLCSDWDGTLAVGDRVVQRSADAIRYFQENGGTFTIASGRYYTYLERFFEGIRPNTYAITMNGAVIRNESETLYSGCLRATAFDLIDRILELDVPYTRMFFYPEGTSDSLLYTPQQFRAQRAQLARGRYYKMMFCAENDADGARGAVLAGPLAEPFGFDAVRSWGASLEIVDRQNNKASAIRLLKRAIGARLCVAVGDYENDIAMIRAADIGYAVANATEQVRAVADRVTASVTDGAIAAIVEDLEAQCR